VNIVTFVRGAVAMGCLVVAVVFFRFWQQSRDRLFAFFGTAFALLAISYALIGLVAFADDFEVYVYVVRLLAFCTILFAIFHKNRR
jgi:hypothetical protein